MAKALDLIGKRFGKLVVVERVDNNKNGNTMWLCQCDCGKTRIALGYDLTHGRTTSCGCNPSGKPNPNRIDLTGKRFGRLQVISLDEEESNSGKLSWKCKCDCGKIISVRGGNLKNGHTRSCGCISTEKIRYNDLTGKRYGRLIVIEYVGKKDNDILWKCKCDCGEEKIATANNLNSGRTKSCGCLLAESRKKPHNLHPKFKNRRKGISHSRIYTIYRGMIYRCNRNYHENKRYYGRGIKVCQEWLGENGFYNFYNWAMNNGYSDNLTIDRIDNDGNYEPTNCRWVTMHDQQNNKNNNIRISYNGETKTLSQWCEELSLNYRTVLARNRRGWVPPKLFEPPHKNQYQ